MKYLLFLIVSMLSFDLHAQIMRVKEKEAAKTLTTFMQSEVKVFLSEDPEQNIIIEAAMKEHWKITPYRLITKEEFNRTFSTESNFFISVVIVEGEDHAPYSYFGVMKGKNSAGISMDQFISYVPVDRYYEYKFENLLKRIDFIIHSLNYTLQLAADGKIESETKFALNKGPEYLNKNAAAIQKKTLLLPEEIYKTGLTDFLEDRNPGDKTLFDEKAFEDYTYAYKILPQAAIAELENAADYCLFIPAGHAGITFLTVYDMETFEVLALVMVPKLVTSQIKAGHIKKLAEMIEG